MMMHQKVNYSRTFWRMAITEITRRPAKTGFEIYGKDFNP